MGKLGARNKFITFVCEPQDKKIILEEAKKERLTLSNFCLRCVIKQVQEIKKQELNSGERGVRELSGR